MGASFRGVRGPAPLVRPWGRNCIVGPKKKYRLSDRTIFSAFLLNNDIIFEILDSSKTKSSKNVKKFI